LFKEIYNNKKVLVTGNTGFKGSWLSAWLIELGAEVYGLSVDVPTNPSHFEVTGLSAKMKHFEADICDLGQIEKIINEIQPDFVFHLAAQALVRLSYENPLLTLQTNIMGSAHILEAIRLADHSCNVVMITSDKCYDNVEWTWGYRETDALGGKDPYSASKGGAEIVIKTYAQSFFQDSKNQVKVAVGRAGNVIGGADWANDRIVPDCMKAWSNEESVDIRNPVSTRPWQHVLEPLSGYLVLGQKLAENPALNGEAFNFGPNPNQNYSVARLIEEMQKHWLKVSWKDQSNSESLHEANLLKLCCDKALHKLNWMSIMDFEETIQFTVDWYRHYYENSNEDMYGFTKKQIESYCELASEKKLSWTL
jgi:CDP-glucose 4,6-dehydratase